MSEGEDRTYVDFFRDMLVHARLAEQILGDLPAQEFAENTTTQLAVVHTLQVLGEAAMHIPPPVQQQFPDIPWRQIIGMRHRIVHAYAEIKLGVVWETVRTDIRPLTVQLAAIIEMIERQS